MELIQTKLNLYLPSDDVVREARPYNIFKKYPNLVIASLTNTSVSASAKRNLKISIYSFNYAKKDSSNSSTYVDYDEIDRSIQTEKINNQDFTLEFISYGLDYPINSSSYSYYSYSVHAYDAAVFKISSPELDKKFPGLDIAILCNPSFLMRQLVIAKTLDEGRLPMKFYYKSGGLYIDKLRVWFEDMNDIRGNQHLLEYSRKRSEDSFVSGKNLVPGRLYSSTRTNYGNYYLYLGDFEKCLTTVKWKESLLFDWSNAHSSNCYGSPKQGQNHGGKLILEFSYFDKINFDLKGLDYISALKTLISSHNGKVKSSVWGGYDIKIVPQSTCLRGIELDEFINLKGQPSPEDLVIGYVDENIFNGNYNFQGNNIITSLVWNKFKNNIDLRDVLVDKFAASYLSQSGNYGMKYENIRENFKTITELDPLFLDTAVQSLTKKSNNP